MDNISRDQFDNIYLNIRFDRSLEDNQVETAKYAVTKDSPIVYNPSLYYLKVVDFTVPLDVVPVWIAPIDISQTVNPNLMTTVINFRYGLVDYPTQMEFIPTSSQLPPPPPFQTFDSLEPTSSYYFSYSYTNFLDSLNTAMATSFAAAGSPAGNAPYFYLNESETFPKIELIIDASLLNDVNFNYISMNNDLLNFLNGFDYYYDQSQPLYPAQFILTQLNNTCNVNGGQKNDPTQIFYYFQQQYYALNTWFPLRKIIILSDSISVNQEFITSTILANQGKKVTYPIIFDFDPQQITGSQSRVIAYYKDQGSESYKDLIGTIPLYRLDLRLAWEDRIGKIYPIFLTRLQSASLKMAFIKRSLVNNKVPV